MKDHSILKDLASYLNLTNFSQSIMKNALIVLTLNMFFNNITCF